jgi:hypothetical protein
MNTPAPRRTQINDAAGLVRFPFLVSKWLKLPQLPESENDSCLEMLAIQDNTKYKPKLSLKIDAAWSSRLSPLEVANARLRQTLSPAVNLPSPVSEIEVPKSDVKTWWSFARPYQYMNSSEFDGYLCCLCPGLRLRHLDEFHFHLVNSHSIFKFHILSESTSTIAGQLNIRHEIRVDIQDKYRAKAANDTPDDRVMDWQRPKTLFDLEAFLKGDETWIGGKPAKKLVHGGENSRVVVPIVVPQRAPHDVPDLLPPNPKQFRVPKAPDGIRFFRLTAKRPLVEGEAISESDDDMDENWLLQKHRDTIESFSDTLKSEKEFIKKYDSHMLKENLSSNIHFREALIRFCRVNGSWLKRQDMKFEFFKNTASLILQGVIDPESVTACIEIINKAEEKSTPDNWATIQGESPLNSCQKRPRTNGDESAQPSLPAERSHDYGVCSCGLQIQNLRTSIRCQDAVS